MKKIGEYTCRGSVGDNLAERIILFDGRFDTAYRVVYFRIAGANPSSSSSDNFGVLATEESAAVTTWDFNDQRQIAWTGAHTTTFGGGYAQDAIIDEDNLIVEDLYFYGNSSNSEDINYIIKLEKYSITDWQGALAMVRNSAQNV
jgi:hypothetical protein